MTIAGTTFFPQGLRHVQRGLPLGDQSYDVAGQITCPTLGFCTVVGSGSIFITEQITYEVFWSPADIGVGTVEFL